MKAFFILIFYSFILATCQEKCYGNIPLPEFKDEHLIGSTWSDDNGYRCVCTKLGSNCCKRHDGVAHRPGCITVKVSFSLIIFSLMLAACKEVIPNTCVDVYDKRMHLFGSTWIAADCFQCDCDTEGMHCCHRNFRDIPGCKVQINRFTCEYEYLKIDDPSQRCEKVSFSLIIFSLMLAACHACYDVGFDSMFLRGKEVIPNMC
ncbi:hypothetical protein E2320_006863 [Naja naja]|nr:hypothetical protein E2320_006863 [Naja naja]